MGEPNLNTALDNLFPKDDAAMMSARITTFIRMLLAGTSDPKVASNIRKGFVANVRDFLGDRIDFLADETLLGIFDRELASNARTRGELTPIAKSIVNSAVSTAKNQAELDKWPFHVIKATKIGDLLRLTLSVGEELVPMSMEVKDLYSQQRFRERYTVATGKYLDRVKNNAFEEFLSGLNIENIDDTGTSAGEMVQDVLDSLAFKVREAETEAEADEAMKSRGVTKRAGVLEFKLNKIKNEYELKSLKPTQLAQCLKDLGCEQIRRGVWKYEKQQ